jgi:transcription elongation factor GreA
MSDVQYMTQEKVDQLKAELNTLQKETISGLAKRIDDARQMGDLSENAEYHAAREDMAWAQSRVQEINAILDNAVIILTDQTSGKVVNIGNTIITESSKVKKEFTIVGAQEADPSTGKISNESPLGSAFLGKKEGEKVKVMLPKGDVEYKIIEIK